MGGIAFGLFLAFAQPAACAVPDAPPRVVSAYPPETPLRARQWGITGVVVVTLELDAASKVTGTKVDSSTSGILSSAALTAAKQSTFQSEVRNCVPQAGRYKYIVEFTDSNSVSRTKATSPREYLVGQWECRHDANISTLENFSYDGASARLTHDFADRSETIAADGDKWVLTAANPTLDLRAGDWTDSWILRGKIGGKPGSIVYYRESENVFRRITDTPNSLDDYYIDVCARQTSG